MCLSIFKHILSGSPYGRQHTKIPAFLKAVEYGSFTKAAEALSYSQSGISRMIGDLEQEWNIILLERGRGGVRLTSDGLRLLPYAQNVCAEYKSYRCRWMSFMACSLV